MNIRISDPKEVSSDENTDRKINESAWAPVF